MRGRGAAHPLADVAGRDLVVRERGSITREVFETRLAEAGLSPGTLIEVQTREAVREAVAAGFGVGVVFESEFGNERASARSGWRTPISRWASTWCAWKSAAASLVRTFIDIAAQIAAGRHPPAAKRSPSGE